MGVAEGLQARVKTSIRLFGLKHFNRRRKVARSGITGTVVINNKFALGICFAG